MSGWNRRVREQKLRVEMLQARKENAAFVDQIETGKKLDQIEERRRRRKRGEDTLNDNKQQEKKKKRPKFEHQPIHDGTDRPAKMAVLDGLL